MAFADSPMTNLKGYFTQEEIRRILEYSKKNPRDYILFLLLARTGRRISEIVRVLKPKHIHPEDNSIEWKILKRKKRKKGKKKSDWRRIPIDRETLEELMNYIKFKNIGMDEVIFKISRQRTDQILKRICEDINIRPRGESVYNKPHVHWFRHSFAIQGAKALKKPRDIGVLQTLLAHKNINNTMWYIRTFNPEEERKLIEKMWK